MTTEQERQFDTYPDYRAAIREAISQARHELLFLERDFSESDLGSKATHDLLWEFFTQHPTSSMRLLAFDPEFLGKHCPRFMQLRERFAHRMELRCIENSDDWQQGFMVIDHNKCLIRHHFDWPRGQLLQDSSRATALSQKFMALWPLSHAPSEWHSLNL